MQVEDVTSEEEFVNCLTTMPEMTGAVNSVTECEIYADAYQQEAHIDCAATVNVLPAK